MNQTSNTHRNESSGGFRPENSTTSRREYRVSPIFGDWDVKRKDNVLSHHGNKQAAIRAAARLARVNGPSVLTIERRDGSIESRRLYGPSQ